VMIDSTPTFTGLSPSACDQLAAPKSESRSAYKGVGRADGDLRRIDRQTA
jgi:hypothetical protein